MVDLIEILQLLRCSWPRWRHILPRHPKILSQKSHFGWQLFDLSTSFDRESIHQLISGSTDCLHPARGRSRSDGWGERTAWSRNWSMIKRQGSIKDISASPTVQIWRSPSHKMDPITDNSSSFRNDSFRVSQLNDPRRYALMSLWRLTKVFSLYVFQKRLFEINEIENQIKMDRVNRKMMPTIKCKWIKNPSQFPVNVVNHTCVTHVMF